MDTLQSIVLSLVYGLTAFIPVSEQAHTQFIPLLLKWATPTDAYMGAIALGALLALAITFRHDCASVISSGIRVIITWQKPMMLDERMPLFLILSFIPPLITWLYFKDLLNETFAAAYWTPLFIFVGALLILFSERMSRRNKSYSYWNWRDSLLLGLGQILMFLPGMGRQAGAFIFASLLNYQREAALKFILFSYLPILILEASSRLHGIHFKDEVPGADLTWLSFYMGMGVSFFVSLFTLNYMLKNSNKNLNSVATYRILFALIFGAVLWIRR